MAIIRNLIWIALLFCQSCGAARILAIVSLPSFSHQLAYRPLFKELSLRGHQVVLFTTDPINDSSLTNLTEIDMHGSYSILSKMNFNDIFVLSEYFAPITMMQKVIDFGRALEHYQYNLKQVRDVVKNENFDLVIAEALEPSPVAFGEMFNCPVIAITSMDAHNIIHQVMGNPTHPVIYPTQDLRYFTPTTFRQRLLHVIFRLVFQYYYSVCAEESRTLLNSFFEKTLPAFDETVKRVQLTFINANPVFYPTRPLSPATVNVFGLHISKPKPLPEDLQNFLDNATQGVIFVSFGTNVHKKEITEFNIPELFLKTFRELPYKIIWKLDNSNSISSFDKILIRSWYPQRDLLAHKNIKLFITQGGLQSLEEALHCRVPVIGIPFLGDQFNNVIRAQEKGIGSVIYKQDLNEEVLKETVLEIIENPRYKERITQLADMVEDTQVTPLENAVWWAEYVLRHKDLTHLKGAAARANLNDYYLFDVILFLVFIFIAVLFTVLYIVRTIAKIIIKTYNSRLNQNVSKKNL